MHRMHRWKKTGACWCYPVLEPRCLWPRSRFPRPWPLHRILLPSGHPIPARTRPTRPTGKGFSKDDAKKKERSCTFCHCYILLLWHHVTSIESMYRVESSHWICINLEDFAHLQTSTCATVPCLWNAPGLREEADLALLVKFHLSIHRLGLHKPIPAAVEACWSSSYLPILLFWSLCFQIQGDIC